MSTAAASKLVKRFQSSAEEAYLLCGVSSHSWLLHMHRRVSMLVPEDVQHVRDGLLQLVCECTEKGLVLRSLFANGLSEY